MKVNNNPKFVLFFNTKKIRLIEIENRRLF